MIKLIEIEECGEYCPYCFTGKYGEKKCLKSMKWLVQVAKKTYDGQFPCWCTLKTKRERGYWNRWTDDSYVFT